MNWRWLKKDVVIAVHDEQIAEHGGMMGVRDHGLLESALKRPEQQAVYGKPSVFDLAAAYAFGIIKNHPFLDGNKRTGFLCAYMFLSLNGWELTVDEVRVVTTVLSLATGETDESEFSEWLKIGSLHYIT